MREDNGNHYRLGIYGGYIGNYDGKENERHLEFGVQE